MVVIMSISYMNLLKRKFSVIWVFVVIFCVWVDVITMLWLPCSCILWVISWQNNCLIALKLGYQLACAISQKCPAGTSGTLIINHVFIPKTKLDCEKKKARMGLVDLFGNERKVRACLGKDSFLFLNFENCFQKFITLFHHCSLFSVFKNKSEIDNSFLKTNKSYFHGFLKIK